VPQGRANESPDRATVWTAMVQQRDHGAYRPGVLSQNGTDDSRYTAHLEPISVGRLHAR
jgi:hypothetical protein